MVERETAILDRVIHDRLRDDPGYRAIPAIDGVGRVLAALFVAEIGDVHRFPNLQALCSSAGMTPRHRESDAKVRRGSITKMACGRPRLSGCPTTDPEVTVTILGGLDIHRAQLTYDYVDLDTGEVKTGRIAPANRAQLREWLERFHGAGEVAFALEGCTGWRYVVEELVRAGAVAHVAEPAETAALRGRKSRAKTDKADAVISVSSSSTGACPSHGFHRLVCWTRAYWSASTKTWSMSGPAGCSGCTPPSSTTACQRWAAA